MDVIFWNLYRCWRWW